MKAPFSPYLSAQAEHLKKLIDLLAAHYDYVSVLATDSKGFRISASQHSRSVSGKNLTTERGNVVRVARDGLYSEYAWNEEIADPVSLALQIRSALDAQLEILRLTKTTPYATPVLPDEPLVLFVEKEADILPEQADTKEILAMMSEVSDACMKEAEHAVEATATAQSTHISKMFLTKNRDLRQSYVFTEASASTVTADGNGNRYAFGGVSGCAGPEILSGLSQKALEAARKAEASLKAERVIPGEYDIITTPDVTGLIAHEAFGHGVEMDMFVKNRALGSRYIDKRVGSDLVTMHEGARCEESVTAYVFDDEGILAGDVVEIDHGILKTGICDALSALRLGIAPTGNGKRENFEHKAYTRMTNTVFDSGDSTLEDMMATIKHGYLLDGMESGMEDPKHWGIQCIVARGYEILDGKLTGKIVAPVVMTGYVPDLLGSVSMASADRKVEGNGACGKGHKEWVKVADGGPYLKAKARLG